MNLKDNLKKIRKDNNLSQEDLAEKLNVSRQSISKWEQGIAYPEMDKVLQICNMFNLNIDELLNQDITKVEKTKQSKINVNKYVEDFLSFVSKTVKMFCSMKFKDKVKCILEQVFIVFILFVLCMLLNSILSSIIGSIFSFLKPNAFYTINNLFEGIFYLIFAIFSIIVILHIFKIRYLDYYVIIDNGDEKKETSLKESSEEKEYKEQSKEKIIIRDPEHSGYRFINGIVKILLFFIKAFLFFVALNFCAALVGFAMLLSSSFLIIKSGILFIGCIIGSLSGIILNLIILYVIFYFISNNKINKRFVFVTLISSLILAGISIGLMINGIKDFRIVSDINSKYIVTTTEEIDMNKKLYFDIYANQIEYVESDNKNIKIEYKHSNLSSIDRIINGNGMFFVVRYADGMPIKEVVKSINRKVFLDPDTFKVIIYTNKDNIKILKDNYKQSINNDKEELISNLYNRINELEQIIDEKEIELNSID